jgi:protein TonB
MESLGKPSAVPVRDRSSVAVSASAHLLVVGALIYGGRHFVAPIISPGTEHGHNITLSYLPGRAPVQSVAAAPKIPPPVAKAQPVLPKPQVVEPKPEETAVSPNTNSPVSDHPDAASGADSLGSGNISIALVKYRPIPRPDLAPMTQGTKGDVVVDITIDESGKISEMKLVTGIEPTIDETVMAAIRQWVFNPANRDGQPVSSEQEVRFHYEKG